MVSNAADWSKRTTAVASPLARARWASFLIDSNYVIADPKVGEQHILTKYSKCNIFQVTMIYSTVST